MKRLSEKGAWVDRIDSRTGLPLVGSAVFGWPFAIAGAAVALLLPLVALLILGSAGVAARAPQLAEGTPIPSMVASSGPAAVLLMEDEGIRGAHIVQASRDFGYRAENLEMSLTPESASDSSISAADLLTSRISSANYLYVASHMGLARRITHLMPAKSFEARVAEGRAQGMPGISEDGQSVILNQDGDLREIHPVLPETSDDIVLLVNASYFIDGSIAELVASFENTPDANVVLVVASLDDDIPDVPAGAREQMMRFLEDVEAGVLQ